MTLLFLTIAWWYVPVCPNRKSIQQLIENSTRIFNVVFYVNLFVCFIICGSASIKTPSHANTISPEFSIPFWYPSFRDRSRGWQNYWFIVFCVRSCIGFPQWNKHFPTDLSQIIQSWDCSFIRFGSWGESGQEDCWQFHFRLFELIVEVSLKFLIADLLITFFGWKIAPPFIAIGSELWFWGLPNDGSRGPWVRKTVYVFFEWDGMFRKSIRGLVEWSNIVLNLNFQYTIYSK